MPNLFHRVGDAAERLAARIGACAHSIALHLEFHWAEFRGDHFRALAITKEIYMADLASLTAAVAWAISQHQADQKTIADAKTALAAQQSDVDALTSQLTAEFGSPPAPQQAPSPEPAPSAPVVPTVAIDPAGNTVVDAGGAPVVATHVPDPATGDPVDASTVTDPVTNASPTPTLVIDPVSGDAVAANATVDDGGNVVPVDPAPTPDASA